MKKSKALSELVLIFRKELELKKKIHLSLQLLKNLGKWFFIATFIGLLSGTASAFFLKSLTWATDFRGTHPNILFFLPLAGLLVGLLFYFFGKNIEKGNNLILEQIHKPSKIIELRMAPFVLIGTVITHLFGGSAGREGTALQMSASISDQLTKLFKLNESDRKILLISGIAAGFGSVFGTPLAGALFGLEVYVLGRIRYQAILPVFIASGVGDYVCSLWGVGHSHYLVNFVPDFDLVHVFYVLCAAVLFGLAGRLFSSSQRLCSKLFKSFVSYPPLRLFYGGLILVFLIWGFDLQRFMGLGLPEIQNAFSTELPSYDFLLKIMFTAITLGAGFKGGEVTPLFFIGATLGNTLAYFIPLPLSFLVALGFVSVFSASANTPLACTLMAIELFGLEIGLFAAISCVGSYAFSGHRGIYSSQLIGEKKYLGN